MTQDVNPNVHGFPPLHCDGWDYHWPGEGEIAVGEPISARLKMQLRPVLRMLCERKQLPNGHIIIGAFPPGENRHANRDAKARGEIAVVVSFLPAPEGIALPASAVENVEQLCAFVLPVAGLQDEDYRAFLRRLGIEAKA